MCTADYCGWEGCSHVWLACDDDDPCTADSCNPAVGCVHTAIPDCTATCEDDVECDDGDPCTTDYCDEVTFSCMHEDRPSGTYYTVVQGMFSLQLHPVESGLDVVDYYAWNTTIPYAGNTGMEEANRSMWFLHTDPSGNLSLVTIHDLANDGSDGEGRVIMSGFPGSVVRLQDDDVSSDQYDYLGTGMYHWHWKDSDTDGNAWGYFDLGFCVLVEPAYWTLCDGIDFVDETIAGRVKYTLPSMMEPFEICTEVCE